MWRGEYDNYSRYDRVQRKSYEAKSVHDHCRELPVHDHFVIGLVSLHAARDEPKLAQNILQFSRVVEAVGWLG